MEDFDKIFPLEQLPAPRRRGRRWFLIGGLAFALVLALGIGVFMGSLTRTSQAAALTSGSTSSSQQLAVTQGGTGSSQPLATTQGGSNYAQPMTSGPGAGGPQGQCVTLTVSSVNGNTIVAKSSNGSSVTIHTNASTRFMQARQSVAASAVKVGTRIHVMGTNNSDGSITATSIDIG